MASSAQLERLRKRFEAIPKAVRDTFKPDLAACGQELVAAMKRCWLSRRAERAI